MNTKVFNLAMMVFWLLLFLGLLARDLWMPPELLDRVSGPQTPLIVMVTAVLAMWNFMRYWIARRFSGPPQVSPEVEVMRRKIRSTIGEDPRVVNPEFDFDKPAPDDPPRNGHQ